MSFSGLLNRTCTIERIRDTDNRGAVGGPKPVWSSVYTNLPCRIEQLSAAERAVAGREGAVSTHRVYFEAGNTILFRDRLTDDNSATYDLEEPENIDGAKDAHHIEALMVRRR